MNYDQATCEIMDGEEPPPRCGNFFASIHGGDVTCNSDNNLDERYDFSVTLTMRVTVALDRVGDQQIARNIARLPLGVRQGFYAKADQLKHFLHMNWNIVVVVGRTPPSANDNLAAWASGGEVYGFCEPMRFRRMETPKLVGGEWFGADPESEDVGVKATLQFGGCRRIQPQTQPDGPFV